ncbi:MAG: hypothetical protein RR911_01210 [Oscillospiraceae bacterium]
MGIIPCDLTCKYQSDGYCTLESVEKVNNTAKEQGCAHYIDADLKPDNSENDLYS